MLPKQEFPDGWSLVDKINFLQRKIILNSMMYYEYNKNFLTDFEYDGICIQLVNLQDKFEEQGHDIYIETRYGYAYYDFDGSTGFHLYGRLNSEDACWLRAMCEVGVYNGRD